MLIACGGGSDSHSTNDQPSNIPQNPGDGTNELPGDGTPETPDNGSGGSTETPPESVQAAQTVVQHNLLRVVQWLKWWYNTTS